MSKNTQKVAPAVVAAPLNATTHETPEQASTTPASKAIWHGTVQIFLDGKPLDTCEVQVEAWNRAGARAEVRSAAAKVAASLAEVTPGTYTTATLRILRVGSFVFNRKQKAAQGEAPQAKESLPLNWAAPKAVAVTPAPKGGYVRERIRQAKAAKLAAQTRKPRKRNALGHFVKAS